MTAPPSIRARALPSNPLRALFPLAARPGMVSFANGHPSPDACDIDGLAKAAARAAREPEALRYGPSVGDTDLRVLLAGRSGSATDAVVVTTGSQQGIDLACRTLADPGRAVAVPRAVYPAVLGVLAANGLGATPVAEDADGIDPDALMRTLERDRPRALYLTPTYGNPTGAVMPPDRRVAILDACAAAGCAVIEDDPYRDLWLDAPAPPAMGADPRGAVVVTLYSASKTLAPGLRIGWMVVPAPLRATVAGLKQATDLQSSGLAQRTVLHYLADDGAGAWMEGVRGLYRARRAALLEGLAAEGVAAERPAGGMFVWARLPEEVDAEAAFERAVARGVLYAPGRAFAVGEDPALERHLRLCFATGGEAVMREGAARLGAALRDD